MDFVRSLFGMLTSSVLRLAVAVGILAAAYLFIVRPVLDTTNKAIESANGFNQSLNQSVNQSIQRTDASGATARQVRRSIRRVNRRVRVQLKVSLHQTAPSQRRQLQLLHCVQHAHGNVHRMQRCTRRF